MDRSFYFKRPSSPSGSTFFSGRRLAINCRSCHILLEQIPAVGVPALSAQHDGQTTNLIITLIHHPPITVSLVTVLAISFDAMKSAYRQTF
jgi:hypothetical protein